MMDAPSAQLRRSPALQRCALTPPNPGPSLTALPRRPLTAPAGALLLPCGLWCRGQLPRSTILPPPRFHSRPYRCRLYPAVLPASPGMVSSSTALGRGEKAGAY